MEKGISLVSPRFQEMVAMSTQHQITKFKSLCARFKANLENLKFNKINIKALPQKSTSKNPNTQTPKETENKHKSINK